MSNEKWDVVNVFCLTGCSGCKKVAYPKGRAMTRRTRRFKDYELSDYYCDACAAMYADQKGEGRG